jgi:sarcosine oxidase
MTRPDVIVAGLGAMGSATAAHLAMRGARVLGLERWQPGHANGSSHGDSRIIREMYFEHPKYVPLVQRALVLWRELERATARRVLTETGGLMAGPRDGFLVSGTIRSAVEHGLPHEVLDAAAVRERFPAFQPSDDVVAVFDPHAGHLDPDAGNAAHHQRAREHGAELRFDEGIVSWTATNDGVRVTTTRGTYEAGQLCLAVGAYLAPFVPELGLSLTVERQVLFWMDPDPGDAMWNAPACPIWAYEYGPDSMCYGFPRLPRGVKASVMHKGETPSRAEDTRRTVRADEVDALRAAAGSLLPGLRTAPVRESATCLFTNTTDLDFVVDMHPAHANVLVSSACSGHGYKFASALGEAQAQWLLDGRSQLDLSPFALARFAR